MAHSDRHQPFPILSSTVLIATACAAGLALAWALAAWIDQAPTLHEAAASGALVLAAGIGGLMFLNRLSMHSTHAMALGQMALSVVRMLGVALAAAAMMAWGRFNPVPTALCLASAFWFSVIAEAFWVGRLVAQRPSGAEVAGSLS